MKLAMRLLIADDERIIRNGLRSLPWESVGIQEVLEAENGLAAKNILLAEKIDILISDIKMPGLSGLELAEYIKEHSMDVAIILLTGYSEFEYARRALQNQVFDYVLKPVRREEILQTVKRLVQSLERERYRANVVKNYESASVSKDLSEQIFWSFRGIDGQAMEILQDMGKNYASGISLHFLAEKYHFSAGYLSRMIKKETGYSFSTILNSIRLAAAEELLQENAKKINLICERAGFSDPKYFSQVFKRTFGCSPGEFRKQGKEKRLCSIKEILEMSDDTE